MNFEILFLQAPPLVFLHRSNFSWQHQWEKYNLQPFSLTLFSDGSKNYKINRTNPVVKHILPPSAQPQPCSLSALSKGGLLCTVQALLLIIHMLLIFHGFYCLKSLCSFWLQDLQTRNSASGFDPNLTHAQSSVLHTAMSVAPVLLLLHK